MALSSDPDDLVASVEEHTREIEKRSLPSPSLVPYCDEHIAVSMLRVTTWLSMEYAGFGNDASADRNRLEHWRCPKPGCGHCYEPRYYGYFFLKDGMGGRIEPNPKGQQQCARHAEMPFMYVGKLGSGRAYMCPFYDCTETGDLIADFV